VDGLFICKQLQEDESVLFYPKLIESTIEYEQNFSKQFGEIIGKKLKKKLANT
jgi:hypothetical protein